MNNPVNKYLQASFKRCAQSAEPINGKIRRAEAKIAELNEEIEVLKKSMASFEAPIREASNGKYGINDILYKKITPTGKTDKNGVELKKTEWLFKYPDTIFPVEGERPVDVDTDMEGEFTEVESEN